VSDAGTNTIATQRVVIRRGSLSDLQYAPNFDQLIDQYAEQSSISGMPSRNPQWPMYQQMVAAGAFHVICAHADTRLVGFVTVLCSVLPHYGALMCTTESFFVDEHYRKGGTGLRMLREAEQLAKDLGAYGLLISAPMGGRLADVLPRAGYEETNRVFFRKLA